MAAIRAVMGAMAFSAEMARRACVDPSIPETAVRYINLVFCNPDGDAVEVVDVSALFCADGCRYISELIIRPAIAIFDAMREFCNNPRAPRQLRNAAWSRNDQVEQFARCGEVGGWDATQNTNSQQMYAGMLVGQSSTGRRNIVPVHTLFEDQKTSTFSWIFEHAFNFLLGNELVRLMEMFIVDENSEQIRAAKSLIGRDIWSVLTRIRICCWHKINVGFEKNFGLQHGESDIVVKAVGDALRDITTFYESRQHAALAFENVKKYAKQHGKFSPARFEILVEMLDSIAGSMDLFAYYSFMDICNLAIIASSFVESENNGLKRNDRAGPKLCASAPLVNLVTASASIMDSRGQRNSRIDERSASTASTFASIRTNDHLRAIDRHVTSLAMEMLASQVDASALVTIEPVCDGVWSAVSRHASARTKIGGEYQYKRRISLKFTPAGVPYLHCNCNFYIQRGVVCLHVVELKGGRVSQHDIHPRFWVNVPPPTPAQRRQWNAECHPTIAGVPGLSDVVVTRLREEHLDSAANARVDDDCDDVDNEPRQSVDFETDSAGDQLGHITVTADEISKIKGSRRFNFVREHLLRMHGVLLDKMAKLPPSILSDCLSEWLPSKTLELYQEFEDHFAEQKPDGGASLVPPRRVPSSARGHGSSKKAGYKGSKRKM
jgi:hypothetical protein